MAESECSFLTPPQSCRARSSYSSSFLRERGSRWGLGVYTLGGIAWPLESVCCHPEGGTMRTIKASFTGQAERLTLQETLGNLFSLSQHQFLTVMANLHCQLDGL